MPKASDETARKVGRKMGVRIRQKGGPIPTDKEKQRRRKGRRREDWKDEESRDATRIQQPGSSVDIDRWFR